MTIWAFSIFFPLKLDDFSMDFAVLTVFLYFLVSYVLSA